MKDRERFVQFVHRNQDWMVLAFIACVFLSIYRFFGPDPQVGMLVWLGKLEHVLAFFAIGVTGRLAFMGVPGLFLWPGLWLLAPGIEGLQYAAPTNGPYSLKDVLASLLGLGAAMGLSLWYLGEKG